MLQNASLLAIVAVHPAEITRRLKIGSNGEVPDLNEVPARLRVPAGAREAIGNAGEGQHLLRRGGTDDAGTSLVYVASMTNDDVK